MITSATANLAAAAVDPENSCPSQAIPSEYSRAHHQMIVKAHTWITKNCACLHWLPVGLFEWARAEQPKFYIKHVNLQAEMDNLIEKRAPMEQFQKVLKAWGRIYCQLARRAHLAMVKQLDAEFKASILSEQQTKIREAEK